MKTYQLIVLFGFVLTMDIALFSLGTQQKELHKDVDKMNSDLERVDRSLERVQKNFEAIQRDLQGIQGPRWQCVPGMTVDAGGSEACVWVDHQPQDRGVAATH